MIPPRGPETLAILPLRNSVLFPASVVPVNVGRPRSVRLIEDAFGSDRPTIGVVAQRSADVEDPQFPDLFQVGTVARVLKVIRLSSGNYSVVLQGVARMRITEALDSRPTLRARIDRIAERPERKIDTDALMASLRESARRLLTTLPQLPREAAQALDNVQEAGALADLVASNLPISTAHKQTVLELLDVRDRLRKVIELLGRQSEVHRVKQEISTMVQEEMSRSQREFLLRQQMRAIRRELGEGEEDEDELEMLRERIARADLPSEAERAAKKQLSRMRTMAPSGAEYQVARTYVEWLADLPWSKTTLDRLDVPEVRRVLDEDHHGLERPKRRIIEFIAVRKLKMNQRGPILCLVGPPGVGKTSLARSIARATGRKFVRVSLGGVVDEAEIRGHRRTYVGSFPGRIIGALKKASAKNPVIVLDEIDKMGRDNRGDPASALLEVLDPEQNSSFMDHYLDVAVDLSSVMFIATANRRDTIPGPLLDRMEVIEIPGYTREEKKAIARQFLIPKQLSEHGLTAERLDFTEEAIDAVVDFYTREAGVRTLEQRVAAICRHVAVRLARGEDVYVTCDPDTVQEVLGPPPHEKGVVERAPAVGVSAGLSWTPAGGDLMFIESMRMPGKGTVQLTGQMGDVMKESAAAAFTYVRARARNFGLDPDFLAKIDVHIHLPQGAVPKDGPSAGIAILVSLASMLTNRKVLSDFAMTGEITLRGNVLRVGGIKDKCLAAHRAGVKHVILPKHNEPDLDELPKEIRDALQFHLVTRVDEALALALEGRPVLAESAAAPPT
jgi:ATP-dependent Lon protease